MLAAPVGGLMASTISRPTVRYRAPDGQPLLIHGELHQPGIDKLRIPQPSVHVLARPRVSELIQRASAHRVTLVCGPAGAGKTVACAAWAAEPAAAGNVAWLSLDPADRDTGRLWAHVRAALASAPAVRTGIAEELQDAPADSFSLRLVEAAERLNTPVTLILDDIQELADSDALAGVDFLVRHGPPALRLLLCGRYPAGLPVARLRVGGDLAEIGAADLGCTAAEADGYFAMLGIDVPAAERDKLLARTQGWMTGLRLAALRVGPDRPASQISGITGDEPAVADYLWDEMLATQPGGRRLFLLRTSIADPICGDLADALTGESGGAAILDQLCRENLMVQPGADAAGPCAGPGGNAEYRYHPLLLDLLRAQFRRELSAEAPQLAQRAAGWLAANGRPVDAIRTAIQAGDWDFAARVLAEVGPDILLPGPAAELEPLLGLFPPSRCASDAAVAASLATAQLRIGDSVTAAQHLASADHALAQSGPGQRRALGPWLQALRLLIAADADAVDAELIDQSLLLARQATADADSSAERYAAGLLWCATGVAQLASRNIADARQCLSQADRQLAPRHLAGGRTLHGRLSNGRLVDAPPTGNQPSENGLTSNRPTGDGLTSGHRGLWARVRGWRALANALHGDLTSATDLVGDLPDRAAEISGGTDDLADPMPARLANLAAAYVSWARDDVVTAGQLLDQRDSAPAPGRASWAASSRAQSADRLNCPLSSQLDDQVGDWLADLARARLSLGDGDLSTARALAIGLRRQGLAPGSSQHRTPASTDARTWIAAGIADPVLAALDADIALRDGDPGQARLALAPISAGPGASRADLMLAQARVLLAEGDSRGALAAVGPCLDGTASQITLHDQISALVTVSVAHRRLGETEQAAAHLSRALTLAEPHGAYRVFLDGGPAARSALTVLIRPGSQGSALAARILQRFDTCPARADGQPVTASVPLTVSELAVLRFLPSHMTNQEIAEALFLSINTVKTHLRSVYRKLGVSTRRQAISRGGRLGLL